MKLYKEAEVMDVYEELQAWRRPGVQQLQGLVCLVVCGDPLGVGWGVVSGLTFVSLLLSFTLKDLVLLLVSVSPPTASSQRGDGEEGGAWESHLNQVQVEKGQRREEEERCIH